MESLLTDLYLYEIILLFLGVFLFILLCAALVYYIIKKDDVKKLLYFFGIPIIMIAYPSIKEIQVGNLKMALLEKQESFLQNPDDPEARSALAEVTEKLENRAKSPEDIKAVTEANLLLGNSKKVIDLSNKAITMEKVSFRESRDDQPVDANPSSTVNEATKKAEPEKEYRRKMEEFKELAALQQKVKSNPTMLKDSQALKQQIQNVKLDNPRMKTYLSKRLLQKTASGGGKG